MGGIVTAGYFFGNVPFVKTHLDKIIWAMILIPGLFVLYGAWKARRNASVASRSFRQSRVNPALPAGEQ